MGATSLFEPHHLLNHLLSSQPTSTAAVTTATTTPTTNRTHPSRETMTERKQPSALALSNGAMCRKSSGRHIKFKLGTGIYSWLESMAVVHNYGSVHKSIRDLLCWACTGQEEDYEWLFSEPHLVTLPPCITTNDANNNNSSPSSNSSSSDESNIAYKQTCTCTRERNFISIDARVSEDLYLWICNVSDSYSLKRGPSSVLDIICRCAIELSAADDIFESNECGHDLAETTAQLYHDLGLIRYHQHQHHQQDGEEQGDNASTTNNDHS